MASSGFPVARFDRWEGGLTLAELLPELLPELPNKETDVIISRKINMGLAMFSSAVVFFLLRLMAISGS
jgi:hypothetical protein